ncbi:MAG: 5'/3'-nucleotidase SurE, partial [Clostridia bacterium]|nr:5'/3'-nucleotidase SurE [Clostridia bacterium]
LVAKLVKAASPSAQYQVDGTPADCVKLALHALCDKRPDIVVSGINDGWNAGTDIHYSGTVGAAMEAAFEGVPAIAVSSAFNAYGAAEERYENAARLAVEFAEKLLGKPLPMPAVLNLNVPRCHPSEIKGIVDAPLSLIRYSDAYDRLERTGQSAAYWIKGDIIEEIETPGGDLDCLLRGYVTVTAIGWDMTLKENLNWMPPK